MSINNNDESKEVETNPLQEVSKTVAITPEDCAGAADFWTHFEVPMPAELKAAFEKFSKDPTWENQWEVKLQVTRAIGFTDHEAFKDDMFKEIVEECRNVSYDMGFEESLENVISEAEKK